MHDVMHALMLADNEDIMERLQELRETKVFDHQIL